MEYPIEFTGVDTPELYRKLYWRISRRGRAVNLVLYVVAALVAAVLYFTSYKTSMLILLIAYIALGIWFQLRPLRIAKKAYNSALKYNVGLIPPTIVRFGENIVFQDFNNSSTVPYCKVKEAVFFEKGLLLQLEEDRVHFAAIDHFTSGSLQELKQLLRERCPGLKISG